MTRTLTIAAALLATPAAAQDNCTKAANIGNYLGSEYGESGMLVMQEDRSALVLFANGNSETWTLVRVLPGGIGCILAEGVGVQSASEYLGDPA